MLAGDGLGTLQPAEQLGEQEEEIRFCHFRRGPLPARPGEGGRAARAVQGILTRKGLDRSDDIDQNSPIMKRVSITELKNRLSEYLRYVKRGDTLEVLERSVPIARIEAVPSPGEGEDARIARLEREGILRRPRTAPDRSILDREPVPCGIDLLAILREDRDAR